MNKDFVEVANDSGSGNGSFDVVCAKNETTDERSTILNVTGSGITKTVNVKQSGVSLAGLDVKFICNGAVYKGNIVSDSVTNGIRNVMLILTNIISAGDQLLTEFGSYVGFNQIDGADADQSELPVFEKLYVSDLGEDVYNPIVKTSNKSNNIYGPATDNYKESIAHDINLVLLNNVTTERTLILANDTCKLTVKFNLTIQSFVLGSKLFIGNQQNFEELRAFVYMGDVDEDISVFGIRQDGVARVGNLGELRFNYQKTIVPNANPVILKESFVLYSIGNSSDQEIISNALTYLDNMDIILTVNCDNSSDTVTLTKNITTWSEV